MNQFQIARDMGATWLESQINTDGIIGDLDAGGVTDYYKVPAALQVSGKTKSANKMIDWIRNNGLNNNGDFGPRPTNELKSYWYTYYNTWVILGAQRLGQFDIAQKGFEFVSEFWDKKSGGFFSDVDQKNDKIYQDLWVVAGELVVNLCMKRYSRRDNNTAGHQDVRNGHAGAQIKSGQSAKRMVPSAV